MRLAQGFGDALVLAVPGVLLDFPMDEPAIPSGLTVDRAGHLGVSLTGGGQVRRYSSAGRPEEVVRVPVTQPTGCTFVGPALDVLVVTTAIEGLSDVDRVVQSDAGRLFTVRVPDVVVGARSGTGGRCAA